MDVSARGLGKVSVRPGVDLPGTASGATRSQVSVATATGVYVTPGTVKYEPAAAKAWVAFTVTGASPIVRGSYNVTTVSKGSTGNFRVIYTTAINTGYAVLVTAKQNNVAGNSARFFAAPLSSGGSLTSAAVKIATLATSGFLDPFYCSVLVFGGLP